MTRTDSQVVGIGAGQADQAVFDRQDLLGHDRQGPVGQQLVGLVQAAGDGVLDGQQGVVEFAGFEGVDRRGEGLETHPASLSPLGPAKSLVNVRSL